MVFYFLPNVPCWEAKTDPPAALTLRANGAYKT